MTVAGDADNLTLFIDRSQGPQGRFIALDMYLDASLLGISGAPNDCFL